MKDIVHGVTKIRTRLSNLHFTSISSRTMALSFPLLLHTHYLINIKCVICMGEMIECINTQTAFTSGSAVKNPPTMQETWVRSWVGKIPWRRKWQPTPEFLQGNPMDRGVCQATIHEVTKESDMT